jgi:hypothetical protein
VRKERVAIAIPLKYVRIFVEDTGVSHFEDCTLPL